MENKIAKIIKLIAIYARVSTARQEEEGTIETQISAIKDFAAKNGYTIVKVYKDEGWSGDNINRPDLDQLRMDAKNKNWEAVLFYDPDRLARRYWLQELVIDELKGLGVESLFVTMPPIKNEEDQLMHGVRGLFSQYERTKITERFRIGKLRKAREGHIITTEAAYGFTYIKKKDKEQGYYVINEIEARVVRMIFEWVANEGLTVRKIIKRLQGLNIKPRKSAREVWSSSTLSTLLRNTAYIGKAHYLKHYGKVPQNPIKKEVYKKNKKTSRGIRPQEEWISILVPSIVSEELFFRAGEQLKNNRTFSKRNQKNEYLLAGKMYCSCGRSRNGEGALRGKHLYYRCTDRIYSFPLPHKCHERGINARIADKLVWRKISDFMSSPELILKQAKKWATKKKNFPAISDFSLREIEKDIQKLKGEEERYVKAYGSGVITLEQLRENTLEVKEKISALKGQVMVLNQQQKQSRISELPDEIRLLEFCQKVKNMLSFLNFETKQKIVREVVEKIRGNQKELLVEGYLPINQDYNVSFKTIRGNCGIAKCR